ncbi:uroporphyrinogen-III synthase [uncultured Methanobrevibacter sp.]|uniref:uroporphyrinogen-III synthase n=1 Tax=uncultured Methanobrevibacter sp. TaxID=253161 RepID=UPI00260E0A50|nr:uroporphyrinogen-III synthase [uncultured Methanobrevibacter sp.]
MSRPVVAITRPVDRSKAACEIVENLGGEYVLAPTLDLKPVNTPSLKNLVANKDSLDWIVFTSPTTITSLNLFYPDFLENLDCKVAVIGNKTGKIAKNQGVNVDLIPDDFTAEGLLEEFEKRNITNQIIGIPRTASARAVLPEGLEKLNNKVILAEAYKSLFPMDEGKINDLIAKIKNKEIDAITFTSPLTVSNFFKIAKNKEELANLLSNNLLTVCIGPITGKILDQYNINYIYPDTYTVQDMMELLFETWRDSHGR